MINTDRRRVMGEEVFPSNAIITKRSNPQVLAVCYAQGWCANERYMTLEEAQAVTDIGTVFRSNTSITHFEEFKYFGVTTLVSYCFQSTSKLESIELPNAITAIPSYAFENSKISNIVFPSSLLSIENYAFRSAYKATSLIIPSGVTTIKTGAFFSCTSITYVSIPSSVTSVGEGAFNSAGNINHIHTNSSIPIWQGNTYNNSTLSSDVYTVLNNNTLLNGNVLFMVARNIVGTYTIPSGVTTIGGYAFSYNKATEVVIPSSVTTIKAYAFRWSTITTVAIPSTVTTLESNGFLNANGIIQLTIGSGITSLPYQCICNMSKLEELNIPASVTTIQQWAIYGNPNLARITVDSNNTVFDSRNNCNAIIQKSNNALIAGSLNTVIPNDVAILAIGCFRGLKITSMDIPASVTQLNTYVFYQNNYLTSLTFHSLTPPTIVSNSIPFTSSSLTIYVPASALEDYRAANIWSNYPTKIQAIPT